MEVKTLTTRVAIVSATLSLAGPYYFKLAIKCFKNLISRFTLLAHAYFLISTILGI